MSEANQFWAMRIDAISADSANGAEISSMLATLCSYERLFGPYHPQTFRLMAMIAQAYREEGEFDFARLLLQGIVRDVGRHLGRNYDLRLQAIANLRDLLVAQRDFERAGEVQSELLECQMQDLGNHHPETLATRAKLATIRLEEGGLRIEKNRECHA